MFTSLLQDFFCLICSFWMAAQRRGLCHFSDAAFRCFRVETYPENNKTENSINSIPPPANYPKATLDKFGTHPKRIGQISSEPIPVSSSNPNRASKLNLKTKETNCKSSPKGVLEHGGSRPSDGAHPTHPFDYFYH